MDVQRARRSGRVRPLVAIALAGLTLASPTQPALARQSPRSAPATESFDQLYERGQRVNASIHTLTAQFTETTTSSLLVRPLVTKGTLAVERPSRVVLHYTEPELRVVLIDNNKMTMTWPSRQVMDIGAAMGRVQRYLVNGSAADLRRQFDIDDRQRTEKPDTYYVLMVPRQKRIRDALDKLELWVDRQSFLLASMRMTFANGDTKTMTFENVTPNAPLPPGIFSLSR
jgi:outer membrane lipoprotein-sorting protein